MSDREDALERVRAHDARFTPVERTFARHVLSDSTIVYKSITTVSEESGVAYTSIVRFCQKLGYSGFHDFKIHLAIGAGKREERRRENTGHWLGSILESATARLSTLAAGIDRSAVAELIGILSRARRILAVAVAGSAPTAQELTYRLVRLGLLASTETDSHMQCIQASLLRSQDVLICVSSSGSTKEIIEAASIAKRRGASLVCLTNYDRSPLAEICDVTLSAGIWEEAAEAEFGTRLPFYFLVEIIASEMLDTAPEARAHLQRTAESVSSRQL